MVEKEKKEQNFPEFRKLLVRAIGPERTQARFAEEAGLAQAQLSRLINQAEIFRPKMTTLQKIAANAYGGITLQDLAFSCGYDVSEVGDPAADQKGTEHGERRQKTPEERALLCMEDFETGIAALCNGSAGYKDALSFLECVQMIYAGEHVSFELSEEEAVSEGSAFPNAEDRCEVIVTFADSNFEVSGTFFLYYYTTKKGKLFPVGASFSPKELAEADSSMLREIMGMEALEMVDPAQSVLDENRKYVYAIRRKKKKARQRDYWEESGQREQFYGLSAEERLLRLIFGSQDTRMRSVEGIGFRLDFDMPNELLKRFLLKHEASFQSSDLEKQILSDVKAGKPAVEAITNSGYEFDKDTELAKTSWGTVIADIISRETGLSLEFYSGRKSTEEQREEKPCILFPEKQPWEYNEVERMLSKNTLYQTLDRYARELRADISRCYFYIEVDRIKGE